MDATKVSIKLFATKAQDQELGSYIPVFHRYIREDSLDELMIDVADYTHVPHGPGVLLVGHAFDLSVDEGEGRPGLVYFRKRDLPEGKQLVSDALSRVLAIAKKLDGEADVKGPRGFAKSEILFKFPDRLHVANDDDSFAKVTPAIRAALSEAGLAGDYELRREGEAREPLTVRATLS